MEVIRVLKMRIYPDDVQKARIDSTIDSCRFVYNHMLARNRKVHDRDQNAAVNIKYEGLCLLGAT